MNSSLPSLVELVQSLSLPGRFKRPDVALLRDTSAWAARLASRALAERMIRADDGFRHADVVIQPVLERRAHDTVHRRHHLGVVEPILRLALELRLLNEEAQHADESFADVLGDNRHAFRRQVVRFDEVAHSLAQAGAQTIFVRAA